MVNTESARWQALITAPISGSYTFTTRHDDDLTIAVDGVEKYDEQYGGGMGDYHDAFTMNMVAGQQYLFDCRLNNDGGGPCFAYLRWLRPDRSSAESIPFQYVARVP